MLLNDKQKEILSGKLLDLANLTVAALIFGQIVVGGVLKLVVAVVGLLVVISIYLYALQLRK